MTAARIHARAPELSIAAVIVVADQLTKGLVRAKLAEYDSVKVIPGLLDITRAHNTGAAFGILNGVEFPYKAAVMVFVALVALAAVGLYALTLPDAQRVARVGLAMILGGALGNLIDRALTGHVVDFVDVYWRTYHFWAFNVADSAITAGVVLMLLDVLGVGRAPKTI
ncbi:MAG TPA: signal peptidase II [Vicinamibacterales bacterium]|jgi:signal peptidase II|nr:signal peptidase II [Vicinamibacterales bacterium]